jgi:hypothetical protein
MQLGKVWEVRWRQHVICFTCPAGFHAAIDGALLAARGYAAASMTAALRRRESGRRRAIVSG